MQQGLDNTLPDWPDIPGGTPSRCNPATAGPNCSSQGLENLAP